MERERLGSTGVGNGFAIPTLSSRISGNSSALWHARATASPFGSLDGKPVHLFLTLLSPDASSSMLHLKALARASRLFKDPALRDHMTHADDQRAIWSIICAEDKRLASD